MTWAHCSTPTLEPDYLGSSSPPDDYLSTPDLSEWKEVQRLEYEKEDRGEVTRSQTLTRLLEEFHEEQAEKARSDGRFHTVAPKDAFHDYERVRLYLEEQARSSLSSSDEEELPKPNPPSQNTAPAVRSSMVAMQTASPGRCVGRKARREEEVDDEDKERAPKRHMSRRIGSPEIDTDTDIDDDPKGDQIQLGTVQPSRHSGTHQRDITSPSSHYRSMKPLRRTAAPKARSKPTSKTKPKSKCNRGEDYVEGPCDCRGVDCTHCQMTCFYTFAYGERKGQTCRRLFEAGRQLDLKRHKAAHAVQEWKWLEDGRISPEEAHWHLVVFGGREHGLMCPNGDCSTTFTRYDALKRHMEHGTCQWFHLESSKEGLNNRQVKAQIILESTEKMARVKRRVTS